MTDMTQTNILQTIDPEIGSRLVSRRQAITKGATVSAGVAAALRIASVPVGLAALSREAFAQGLPQAVKEVLQFALTLEYLEAAFYNAGVAAAPGGTQLIPTLDRTIFTTIQAHENIHVSYLQTALGADSFPAPSFDFTAGGLFPDVFTSYATFKLLAQGFEDTGVRAYKGQAGALQPFDAYLTAALAIHSVEARHAAEVRRLRGNFSEAEPFYQGWITLNQVDDSRIAATYAGEEITTQLGISITSVSGVDATEASESFDEPLTKNQVLAIVAPFIV